MTADRKYLRKAGPAPILPSRRIAFACNPCFQDFKIVVEQHQIGPKPWSDPTGFLVQAKEGGRRSARHLRCLGKVDAQYLDSISDRARHIEIRSREPSFRIIAGSVAYADRFALQHEARAIPADARHGIADQHEAVVAMTTKGEAKDRRIYMAAIDDDPAPSIAFKRRANDSRLAAGEWGHGIEEMGDAAETVGESRAHPGVGRVGVACRENDPRFGEPPDRIAIDHLGRERRKHSPMPVSSEKLDGRPVEWSEMLGFVDTLSAMADERPFDVRTNDAWNSGRACICHRAKALLHDGEVVADQGREKPSSSEPAMRSADAGDRLHCWRVVEQYVSAAIDLRINKPWQEQSAIEIAPFNCLFELVFRDHRRNPTSGDFDREPIRQTRVSHDPTADECEVAHRVSVTFVRCGGASGLRPRRAATLSSIW